MGMIARAVLAAPGVFVAGWLSAGAALAQDAAPDCTIDVPPDEVLGETFLCGQIDVPEDWDAPEGRTFPLSYVVLRSPSLAPFRDPVIYFQGGPGGSALNALGLIASGTEGLRANRDIVVFDQRGTARSNDLFCPLDVQVTDPARHEENIAAADARIDALGVNAFSDQDAVFEAIDAYWRFIDRGRCLPLLEARGIDVSQYDTANSVLDAVALMQHLDYPAYTLFGGSYGTTVALGIMDHYAEHEDSALPELRAVVLDGVAPLNRDHHENALATPWVVLRVFATCESDPACNAAYPSIRQRAIRLLATLRAEPLAREDGAAITADDLAEVLRSAVTNQKGLVPWLPRLVDELERGETAVFDLARAALRYEITLPDAAMQAAAPEPEGLSAITAELDSISSQFDAIEEQLGVVLLSNGIIRDSILEASTRAELFLAIYDNYLDFGGGMVGNVVVARLEPYLLHPEQRTRAGLIDFIRASVSLPVLQAELVGLAEQFSEAEIAQVFGRLTAAGFARGIGSIDSITHRVVTCNDEAGTIFNDEAFAAYRAFEAPELIGKMAYMTANYQVSCRQLGLAVDSYAPPPPGVVSDVPTLVINGALDTATPAEWGLRAAETLENASVVSIAMAGHTAGLLDKCGNALVEAFVLSPGEDFDRSCAEAAQPAFVLPDDPLPQ